MSAPLTNRDVYEAWAAAMDRQGRVVAPERRSWDTLPQQERDLDADIAYQLNQKAAAREPLAVERLAKALRAWDDQLTLTAAQHIAAKYAALATPEETP